MTLEQNPLYRLVAPRSIAFFGASNDITAMGTSQLKSLLSMGYRGAVYPVHPTETQVQGLEAYSSVLDLPEVPDLAVLVLPTRVVPEVLEQCGQKGIGRAIVISGGFKELGQEGAALERRLAEIAERFEMRFLGPNCLGAVNPRLGLNTTFLPYLGEPGCIGMVSQSGSFVTQMFDYIKRFGLGYSTAFSVGNEANVDLVDCLEYLAADPDTRVIALYIEGIRRGRAFLEAAQAITPHKPIVAYYVSGSAAGRQASLSHTGALAGPDRLYDGVFRQAGISRARSIEELFDLCSVLATCPLPRGRRVLIQTHSGGPGAAAADACGRLGLDLPPASAATRARLAPAFPSTGSQNNPIDITFSRNPLDYYELIPEALIEAEEADALLMYMMIPTEHVERIVSAMGGPEDTVEARAAQYIEQMTRALAAIVEAHDKPLIGFSFRSRSDVFIQVAQRTGVAVLPSPERAARALAALCDYARMRERLLEP